MRAEYDLARYRWFALQLDAGGFWSPTQSFSVLYGEGSSVQGAGQSAHVHLGLAARLTPFPRGWISPYGLFGIAAVQSWTSGGGYLRVGDGSIAEPVPLGSGTRGDLRALEGLGLRFRLGARPVQLEIRRLAGIWHAYTIGTALRF